MKNKNILILIVAIILVVILGVSYAFFNYYKEGSNQEIVAGKVRLTLTDNTDTISILNVFPETKEEARAKTDNVLTFTVSGYDTTTNKDIYYEIRLNEGDERDGMTRFLAKHLVFDLIEVEASGTETMVVDAMSYNALNEQRIWVNSINRNNEDTFSRTYKLRMWIDESVFVSDTALYADYTANEFKNGYASVKVSVYGDLEKKALPYNYMARLGADSSTFWPASINAQKTNITAVNFVSLKQSEIDTRYAAATIKEDVSNTTETGSVKAWLETDASDATKYVMYVASEGITIFPNDCSYMFSGMKSSMSFGNVDTTEVTNMAYMFAGFSGSSINLAGLDTRNVTNMMGMFTGTNLTTLDLTSFDTGRVTTMNSMFAGSTASNIDVSKLDTSNVTDMYQMFAGCSNLVDLDVRSFNTENVTNMYNMFVSCSNLTSLDLSGFDTSEVTNMSTMFASCSKLTSLNLSSFDFSKVINTSSMMAGCSGLSDLNISGFEFSETLTSYSGMFGGISNTTIVRVGSKSAQAWILANPSTGYSGWTTANVIID